MKNISALLLSLSLLSGCAATVSTQGIRLDEIPAASYEAYFYLSGEGNRLRAVFLALPETAVEVVPYSRQIVEATASAEEAAAFVGAGRRLRVESVSYRGETVGYLLTRPTGPPVYEDTFEVHFAPHNGRLYLMVTEHRLEDL